MSIYKECDIRGIYGKELDNNEAKLIGKSIATILDGATVVVGGDARNSTRELKKQLIEGLISCGCSVIDIGTIPTPVLYFAKGFLKTAGSVMVTASHNPAQYNGFKITVGEMPVTPEDIEMIANLVESKDFLQSQNHGSLITRDIQNNYTDFLKGLVKDSKALSIVIDCCNGAASEIVPRLLKDLGHEVIELFCSFDGSFPNRDPNPSAEKNLEVLKAKVIAEKADLGIAFDGDGDRAIFIDDKGRFCEAEKTFVVLLKHYLKETVSNVVYDAKSSSIVKKTIKKLGSIPIMERSGHAFMKRTFLENNSILAGEVSGHYFFGELGFDDGIYAAIKMAEIIAKSDKTMFKLINEIESTVITPDIRIEMSPQKVDYILNYMQDYAKNYQASYLDGVRIELPKGWVLVRKSVTEPCITIRLEADSLAEAEKINRDIFYDDNFDIYTAVAKSLRAWVAG